MISKEKLEHTERLREALREKAQLIHTKFDEISDLIEEFNQLGGQVNLRVYHNGGGESIDLHELNGEFETVFLQIEVLEVDLDDPE